MTKSYEVTWKITVPANTHEEAAEIAWDYLSYPEPRSSVLTVSDGVEEKQVDLND